MNVYISGPISGKKDFNEPAFERAQFKLEGRGYHVFNPHKLNGALRNDLPREVYLKRDIQVMFICEAIFMLRDWELSRGARCEFLVACEFGLEILYEEGAEQFQVSTLPSIDFLMEELNEAVIGNNTSSMLDDNTGSMLDDTQAAAWAQKVIGREFADIPTVDTSEKPSALSAAQGLVYGDRQEDYDHPLDNFTQIAEMLNALWIKKLNVRLGPNDIAPMMILTKLSRHSHSWKFDNLVDIAGYAETDLRVFTEKKKRNID